MQRNIICCERRNPSPRWIRSREAAAALLPAQAADGIRGSRIHSSSYASVSSQVRTKLQIVNAEALRSLPHPPPPTAHGSHCAGKLYPWRVFCISHSKIALAETQELFECSGEANQAASKRQQSKGDFKQLPLLWEEEWGEESSLV